MVIVWTPEWDAKLLVAIWETCGSKFDWETTASIMGGACTPEALMQHLRNLTRKHANKRREQREVLIEAHRARAASVAMGKARRKWGYSRNMVNRIDTLTEGSKSATAASSKAKAKATTKGTRTSKRSPDIESVSDSDELVSKHDRQKMSRVAAQKKMDDSDQEWDDTDEAETTIPKPLTIKLRAQEGARALNDRRGTFWNNYRRNQEDEEDYD